METIPMYYFGCAPGNRFQELFAPGVIPALGLQQPQFPFPWEMLYGHFCHTRKGDIGEMTLTQVYGWTILSFLDNTTRVTFVPNSSNFIAPGTLSTMGMLDLVVKHFPEVYRRVLPILKIREPSSSTTSQGK